MENLNKTVTQSKNVKYIIIGLIFFAIFATIASSSELFNELSKPQTANSKTSQNVKSNEAYPPKNLKPDILSGDSNTSFYYKGMQIKLVESGVLTPEIQSKAPEFCVLSKRCGTINSTLTTQKDKIDYFLGFIVTNTTNQITVSELLDDISGQNTLLVDSTGKEYTKADYSGSNSYCSANPNIPSVSRDTLPGESRLVDFCFSLPSSTVVKQFKTNLNKIFFTGFDFSDKYKLTIDLKPDYYTDYSSVELGKPELSNFGDEKVVNGLKIKIVSTKIQDPKELVKVIKPHTSIENQVAILMELENTSDKEISVENAYDFVFNHKIGVAEKDYAYLYSDSLDATADFKTESKLAPKQKIYMYHYFGISQKDINLKDYHLSVIYNSASRKGSFEKNNTQWQAFSLSN